MPGYEVACGMQRVAGNLKERDHVENRGVDDRIILKWVLKDVGWESLEWIDVAQDSDK
jgi:hypothetical protein